MVRHATESDLPRLVAMAKALHDAVGESSQFDAPRIAQFMSSLIEVGVVVVSGDPAIGMIALSKNESAIAPITAAVEHMLWVNPSFRKPGVFQEMLQAAEDWARSAGCARIQFTSQIALRGRALSRMLSRSGFTAVEVNHIKPL